MRVSMISNRRFGLALVAVAVAFLVLSCSSLGYVSQSLWGGASILVKRHHIERVLERDELNEEWNRRLRLVLEALDFAHRELALPDNGSYRSFVQIDRPYVVWNVVAAPEFSVDPVTWCFPITGCVSYRGYFSERRARSFADKLARRGLDVSVGGVAAYSTLGWFKDPVLSTFFVYSDAELVGLLFHELAHQVVYVKGDTAFNESFATLVEEEGLRRWLERRGEGEAWREWRRDAERRRRVTELVLEVRDRLDEVYRGEESNARKEERKTELFEELRRDYDALRASWRASPGYDDWFAGPLNNADLASFGVYWQDVPALRALFQREQGDFERFFSAVRELAKEGAAEREGALAGLLATEREGD